MTDSMGGGRWDDPSLPHPSWTVVPSNYFTAKISCAPPLNKQCASQPQPVGVDHKAKSLQQKLISGVTQRFTFISRSWYSRHLGIAFARVRYGTSMVHLESTTGDLHGISVRNRNRLRRVQSPCLANKTTNTMLVDGIQQAPSPN